MKPVHFILDLIILVEGHNKRRPVMPNVGKLSGNVAITFRLPAKLAAAYEKYVVDECLDRNLVASLLFSRYLIDRGFVVDEAGAIVQKKGETA
jgi:hypothetical protein